MIPASSAALARVILVPSPSSPLVVISTVMAAMRTHMLQSVPVVARCGISYQEHSKVLIPRQSPQEGSPIVTSPGTGSASPAPTVSSPWQASASPPVMTIPTVLTVWDISSPSSVLHVPSKSLVN